MADPICVFLPSFAGGGAERVMIILANALHHDGHDVQVCVADNSGPRKNELVSSIPVTDLDQKRLLRALPSLIRYITSTRPKVLFTSIMHANIVAWFATFLSRVPCKVVVREALSLKSLQQEMSFPVRHIWFGLAHFAYRRAFRVIAVSQAQALELENTFGLKAPHLVTIYNPLDQDIDFRRLDAPVYPEPWMATNPYILAVGRLTYNKGFDVLIRSMAHMKRRRSQSVTDQNGNEAHWPELPRLVIVGTGSYREALLDLAAELGVGDWVSLPGYSKNPYALMQHAVAFILPSRFEGMPNVLLQALACGVPLVAADCPTGPAEILEKGRWGKLVPVADPIALADAIEQILAEPPERAISAEAVKRFDHGQVIAAYKRAAML